jgi:hypothetical protein
MFILTYNAEVCKSTLENINMHENDLNIKIKYILKRSV